MRDYLTRAIDRLITYSLIIAPEKTCVQELDILVERGFGRHFFGVCLLLFSSLALQIMVVEQRQAGRK